MALQMTVWPYRDGRPAVAMGTRRSVLAEGEQLRAALEAQDWRVSPLTENRLTVRWQA